MMDLLVSAGYWLFRVDSDSHKFTVLRNSEPKYYGISWTLDGKQLCLAHSGVDYADVPDRDFYFLNEKGILSVGEQQRPDCLSFPHQILCTEDHVLAANTGRNCITVFNQSDLFHYHHWVDGVQWDRRTGEGEGGSHFNSLYRVKDRLFLLAHNRGAPDHSYILELEWCSLAVIRRIETRAYQAHNVWVPPSGEIIICDSMGSSLVEVNSGQTLWQSKNRKSYTRGLACHGETVFVGDSVVIANRKARLLGDGGIYILDRDTWTQVDYIPLPRAGGVNEIRILDIPDECHHGQPFTGELDAEPQADSDYRQHVETLGDIVADDFRIGEQAWEVTQGFVSLTDDRSIHTGEGALVVAVRQELSAVDVDLCADVCLLGDEEFRHGGLVARYSGPRDENMYLAMVVQNGEHRGAGIWRNIAGKWEVLAKKPIEAASGRLRFQVRGSSLVLSLNGRRVIKVRDKSITAPGKVGIRGIDAGFDGFQVKAGR
jgi:hypothetical protein